MSKIPYNTAWCFVHGKRAASGALTTDGQSIYSYGECLAFKHLVNGMICVKYNSPGFRSSITTSKHVKALATVLEEIQLL